jgi:thioredoxin 1
MQEPNSISGGIVRVAASDLANLIASSDKLPVLVDVSTDWCFPCQILRPILHKIGIEFVAQMRVIEVDGNTCAELPFRVEAFPTLLFFRDGQLVNSQRGFESLECTYAGIMAFLGRPAEASSSEAESAFCKAHRVALAEIDAIMTPASEALAPHMAAIDSEWKACEAYLSNEQVSGRLTRPEAARLRQAEWERLSEPFKDKKEAHGNAQKRAIENYRHMMGVAVSEYAAAAVSGRVCAAGDPFCRVA